MKIALLNPMGPKHRFDDSNDQLPPLGLLYLAAAVRPRHAVCVLDGELLKRTGAALLECLPFEPDLLGIGGTTSQAGEAHALARSARAAFPGAKIVAGGTHATILGEEYLRQCDAFDALVLGPGETPFAMLADGKDPATVPQTIVREGAGFHANPAAPATFAQGRTGRGRMASGTPDLAVPASPARDLVNVHHYPGTSHRLFRQTSIMATRGCPFRCAFCSNAVWGRRWRPRPIESVLAELREIAALDFAEVFFQDDTLNANPEWTLELFRAIREAGLGLEYKVDFRANARLLPNRLLEAAREAGVREIFFGVESGNDAIREAAGKGLPRKDILRAVRAAQEHGMATLCAFIVGLPGETAETVQETIRFARELNPDTAGFSIATPFPGTELRAQAIRDGLLTSEDYGALTLGVPVMKTDALTCAQVAQLRDQAAREWEAHARSRSPDAEKRIRALEEKSCREALALALARDDAVGQAIISARLARIRMDSGVNAEAIELSVGPLSEPGLSLYDRAKAGVVLAVALRREGMRAEAAAALDRVQAFAHPALGDWIERERRELGPGSGTGNADCGTQTFAEPIPQPAWRIPHSPAGDAGPARCKICRQPARLAFAIPISKLAGHPIPEAADDCSYYECSSCGFVFTDATDHLRQEEVYDQQYWENQDPDWHGRVSETLRLLLLANQLLKRNPWEVSVLDFGCGMGCAVETLRNLKVQCWGTDLIEPKFGREFFLRDVGERKFDAILATEVVEHFTTPMDTFRRVLSLLKPNGVFAFQTAIYDRSRGREWWYIGPANGHVSLFSPGAFQFMKRAFGVTRSLVWNDYHGINAWQVGPDRPRGWHGETEARATASGGNAAACEPAAALLGASVP